MSEITEEEHRLADFCRAMSNALRLKLVRLLKEKEQCVKSLAATVDRDQSVVSRHLRKLSAKGLVRSKTLGRENHYRLKRPELIEKLLEIMPMLTRR